MVAVRSHEAEKFLRGRADHVLFYLFFGTDAGLTHERARQISRAAVSDPNDPFQLVRVDGDAIAADPALLADEANTVGLFGGRRSIWVSVGSKNIVPSCESLLADPPRDCTIILEAGALKRDSALRRLFEQQRMAAAVECNQDDAAALHEMVSETVRLAGLTITDEARETLVSLLGEDRLSTRSEVEKLVLFTGPRGEIDRRTVELLIADSSVLEVESALEAAFTGRIDSIEEILIRYFKGGGDPGVLLGQALRHALMLHRSKLLAASGMPIEAAVERVAIVPFHVRKSMLIQARAWLPDRLLKGIEGLSEGIRRTRREPRLAAPIATRVLWSLALGARAKRS